MLTWQKPVDIEVISKVFGWERLGNQNRSHNWHTRSFSVHVYFAGFPSFELGSYAEIREQPVSHRLHKMEMTFQATKEREGFILQRRYRHAYVKYIKARGSPSRRF
jgi:hypothetical protein